MRGSRCRWDQLRGGVFCHNLTIPSNLHSNIQSMQVTHSPHCLVNEIFAPVICPYLRCSNHRRPRDGFFVRFGSYRVRNKPSAIPRFRCRACGRTFSRQTFRADYRLKLTQITGRLWWLLVSGVSLRQAGRILQLSRSTVSDRLRRFGGHSRLLHARFIRSVNLCGSFHLDEIETFEHHRIHKPLTVAVLMHSHSFLLLSSPVGTLRTRASKESWTKQRRTAFESSHGRRLNESNHVVSTCLKALDSITAHRSIELWTDEKPSYAALLKHTRQKRRIEHHTIRSTLPRTTSNPLFPINHMENMLRYGISRLIRQSFLASKKKEMLDAHLSLHRVWWNLCRLKTNRSRSTPAMACGVSSRQLAPEELFAWRQDMEFRQQI